MNYFGFSNITPQSKRLMAGGGGCVAENSDQNVRYTNGSAEYLVRAAGIAIDSDPLRKFKDTPS